MKRESVSQEKLFNSNLKLDNDDKKEVKNNEIQDENLYEDVPQ